MLVKQATYHRTGNNHRDMMKSGACWCTASKVHIETINWLAYVIICNDNALFWILVLDIYHKVTSSLVIYKSFAWYDITWMTEQYVDPYTWKWSLNFVDWLTYLTKLNENPLFIYKAYCMTSEYLNDAL